MFDIEEFDAHLNEIGQDVKWRRAYACPCVTPNSGQPKTSCKVCRGKGRTWVAAVDARTGVAGGSFMKRWREFGMYEDGDVILSIPSDSPLYEIGPYDRVLFMNRTEPFSRNVVKGVNEEIRFPVVELEKVLYIADDVLVSAPLPAILPDGALNWTGVELPDGVTFSITGRRRAEYFMWPQSLLDRPHNVGAALPRRVVMRRFDLYQA